MNIFYILYGCDLEVHGSTWEYHMELMYGSMVEINGHIWKNVDMVGNIYLFYIIYIYIFGSGSTINVNMWLLIGFYSQTNSFTFNDETQVADPHNDDNDEDSAVDWGKIWGLPLMPWMVYFMENTVFKCMMTGGTPMTQETSICDPY